MLVKAYEAYTGAEYVTSTEYPFDDGYSISIHKAYELGFMNGISEKNFSRSSLITREQMAKVLIAFKSVISGNPVEFPTNIQADFIDFHSVSDWAKPYVAMAASGANHCSCMENEKKRTKVFFNSIFQSSSQNCR